MTPPPPPHTHTHTHHHNHRGYRYTPHPKIVYRFLAGHRLITDGAICRADRVSARQVARRQRAMECLHCDTHVAIPRLISPTPSTPCVCPDWMADGHCLLSSVSQDQTILWLQLGAVRTSGYSAFLTPCVFSLIHTTPDRRPVSFVHWLHHL